MIDALETNVFGTLCNLHKNTTGKAMGRTISYYQQINKTIFTRDIGFSLCKSVSGTDTNPIMGASL